MRNEITCHSIEPAESVQLHKGFTVFGLTLESVGVVQFNKHKLEMITGNILVISDRMLVVIAKVLYLPKKNCIYLPNNSVGVSKSGIFYLLKDICN